MASYLRDKNGSLVGDDDIDDEYFLRSRPNFNQESPYSTGITTNTAQSWGTDNDNADLVAKRLQIEDRTLKSTHRALQHLRNSEFVGVATAEELLHQREQLERTGRSLDDINSTLRFSQRHIQGIKSVFGGLKNLISGKPAMPTTKKPAAPETESPSPLSTNAAFTSYNDKPSPGLHPALILADKYVEMPNGPNGDTQKILNDNMEEILGSVKKLKELASGLGEEIDSQNDLIEIIVAKADRADQTLARQNKDIKKLL